MSGLVNCESCVVHDSPLTAGAAAAALSHPQNSASTSLALRAGGNQLWPAGGLQPSPVAVSSLPGYTSLWRRWVSECRSRPACMNSECVKETVGQMLELRMVVLELASDGCGEME